MLEKVNKSQKYITLVVLILAILGLSGGSYLYYQTAEGIIANTGYLEEKVMELGSQNIILAEELQKEQAKNGAFETQIGEISGTVGKLDKLSKTDKELLQKYSKVYFLNEHYIPEELSLIPTEFIYESKKEIKIHTKVLPNLVNLLNAAKNSDIDLEIISGFRSFGEQSALKGAYTVNYGSGANTFSADQGYSEHQLGTTIDFTTASVGATFSGFSKTKEYEWLIQNAYKYGFIISYPKDNGYYEYEPWHWRFVGKSLAKRLNEERQNFYDLEQRTIDSYLINIFD